MALGRLSTLKSTAFLNINSTDYDSELQLALIEASEILVGMTNRELQIVTYDDQYHSPIKANRLMLKEFPVQELTSVKFWDASDEAWETESLDYFELIDKLYLDYPKLGQESNSTYAGFTIGSNTVKVTYAAGYITSGWAGLSLTANFGVPRDLEGACCGIAEIHWSFGRGDKGLRNISSRSFGSESVTYENFKNGIYPDEIMNVVDRYRRAPVIA